MGVSGQQLQFEFTDGYEMLHKAWNSKGEVPYCFPRSSIKFQGHTGKNITDFDPNWAFPDYRPVAAFKSLRFALLPGKLCFHQVLTHKQLGLFLLKWNFRSHVYSSMISDETGKHRGKNLWQHFLSFGLYHTSRWCHDTEILSDLLALCVGNPLVNSNFSLRKASNAEL